MPGWVSKTRRLRPEDRPAGTRQRRAELRPQASPVQPSCSTYRPATRWLGGPESTPQDFRAGPEKLADPDSSGLTFRGLLCSLLGKRIFVSFCLECQGALRERPALPCSVVRLKKWKSPLVRLFSLKVTILERRGRGQEAAEHESGTDRSVRTSLIARKGSPSFSRGRSW